MGIRDAADLADDSPARYALLPGRGTGIHRADNAGRPLDPMSHVDDNEADYPEDKVKGPPGRDNGHALPDRLVLERTRIIVPFVALAAFADHLHVTTQRDPGDLVERLPAAEATARYGGAEADAKRFHVHVAPLRHEEMA